MEPVAVPLTSVVAPLVRALIRQAVDPVDGDPARDERTAAFVLRQMARMPAHLRLPILALTWVFGQTARLRYLRAFERLAPPRQDRLVAAWRGSRLGPRRQLIRFYESLALYGWHAYRFEETRRP